MRDIQQDVVTIIGFYRKWIRLFYESEYRENIKTELDRDHDNPVINEECKYLKLWLDKD